MIYSLSVVIPNYNGKNLLEKNIPFLLKAIKKAKFSEFEIIIPDDNSNDTSVEFLRNNYPKIKVIENRSNKGFAGNVNTGLKEARMDLILILNSDIQLLEKYFVPLVSYFEDSNIFGVMGRIIDQTSNKIQVAAKAPIYSYGNIVPGKNYLSYSTTSLLSMFLSGANALVDRKKLEEIGFFNENFNPYYYEDVELGLRAWRMGYLLYYEHLAICKHEHSATISKEPESKIKMIAKRNKMMMHFLHLNGLELYYYMIVQSIKVVFRLMILDFRYVKSYALFLKSLSFLKMDRKKIATLQKRKKIALEVKDVIKAINIEMEKIDSYQF